MDRTRRLFAEKRLELLNLLLRQVLAEFNRLKTECFQFIKHCRAIGLF